MTPPIGQLEAVVVRLRAQAAELLALAAQLERGAVVDHRDAIDLAADFITAHPGAKGLNVATAAGVDFGHFRARIVPKLKARGFTNDRGRGYRPPADDVAPRNKGATSALHTKRSH